MKKFITLNRIRQSIQPRGTVARFGSGILIRMGRRQFQLVGGTRSDRVDAQEWISLCMHESVLSTGE